MKKLKTQALVIGSGAGGALGAAYLAKNGFEVLMIEEGHEFTVTDFRPSTTEMMEKLYRGGGINPILGRPSIALAEGRCVGGSTVINAAIMHRTPDDVIERWEKLFDIKEFSVKDLAPHFREIEHDMSVNFGPPSPASIKLETGAKKLGWLGLYSPRATKNCINANMCANGCPTGAKQSMINTYIPVALSHGAKMMSNCKATKILIKKNVAHGVYVIQNSDLDKKYFIEAEHVFVCGGAIQTPYLLQRSGVNSNIGSAFHLHPSIKVVAKFNEELNLLDNAFPTYQVKEFSPDISLGGSLFSPVFVAMVLKNTKNYELMKYLNNMAIYYTMTRSSGIGSVKKLPFVSNSVIPKYIITKQDHKNLSLGLAKLSELLITAGAEEVYPDINNHAPLRSINECRYYYENLIPLNKTNLYTIHIFSSCPMGENKKKCGVDSFGRVHGINNLYVMDASVLPDAPGVNPQETIMAIAKRNIEHFIATHN